MTTLQDRARAFEAKFAHDHTMRFLTEARRDKLFARWAADVLGLSDDDREALVRDIVAIHGGGGHDARVMAHIANLFALRGRAVPGAALPLVLRMCGECAERDLLAEPGWMERAH